ncbi:MAG: hypothetical protein GX316_06455 [Firmicutes bacterium]|nr:hypothetical protein [Bacillota bacterium]
MIGVEEAVFKIAVWITIVSGALMFVLEPKTPSFVINIGSLIVGIILMGVIALSIRLQNTGEKDDSQIS